MNKIIIAFLLYLFSFIGNINSQSFLEDEVTQFVNDNNGGQKDVFIWLKDRVNIESIEKAYLDKSNNNKEKTVQLISTLKEKSKTLKSILNPKLKAIASPSEYKSIRWNWITNGFQILASSTLIEKMSQWPEVQGIYSNMEGKPNLGTRSDVAASPIPHGAEPGLRAINAPAMWSLGYTGYGRKAYIFDSGEDYGHKAIRQQFYGNFNDFSNSWSGGNDQPFDIFGHGTHVTGTICGLDRLNHDTIGVAFNANWIGGPVQFTRSDVPTQPYPVRSFIDNMQFALDPDNNSSTTDDMPDAINNSWSGFKDCSSHEPFSEVIRSLEIAGIANIWSAGNDGPNPSTLTGYQNVNYSLLSGFSIGATQTFAPYDIADFSSRGPSLCPSEDGPLAIKPEVSAPGVTVRSSINGGTYANYNGTSMASPHVTGAVLLLKEAFPYLSGDDILYALYYSAIDLGAGGEDNVYGRGIIDVYAAYLYLIDHGNSPVPPISNDHDLMIINLDEAHEGAYCKGTVSFSTLIYNNSIDTVTFFKVYTNEKMENKEKVDSFVWNGTLLPYDTVSFQFSDLVFDHAGKAMFEVRITSPDNDNDSRMNNNTWRREFEILDNDYLQAQLSENQVVCKGSSVKLSGIIENPNFIPTWYSEKSNGQTLGKGPFYITGPITKDVTYYYDVLEPFEFADLYDENTIEYDATKQAGLLFDVKQDLYLNSVKVYAKKSTTCLFNLSDAAGTKTFYNQVVTMPSEGEYELNIDAFIPKGSNYKFSMVLGKDVAIQRANINFPYSITDVISIKENFGYSDIEKNSIFPYFFDWKLSVPNECGRSAVHIAVDTSFSIMAGNIIGQDSIDIFTSNTASFSPEMEDPTFSYHWDFGNGQTSEEANATTTYLDKGEYNVILNIVSSEGCTHTVSKKVFVYNSQTVAAENIKNYQKIQVVPNPTKSYFYLKGDQVTSGILTIYNINGSLEYMDTKYKTNDDIYSHKLSDGIHIAKLQTTDQQYICKFVVTKQQ